MDNAKAYKEKTIHEKRNTETIAMGFLEFSLFFVCYGVSRMICQPWMWELHFWPVMMLALGAFWGAALFVFIVAHGIPSFLSVMCLPPYVDGDNMMIMLRCARQWQQERG